MLNDVAFNLPDGHDPTQTLLEMAEAFSVAIQPSVAENRVYYDTFDWRLFNKSLILFQTGQRLVLRRLGDTQAAQAIDLTAQLGFVWDLPEGPLKDRLTPVLKMRALLRLAALQFRSTTVRVLNRDAKTVARLVLEETALPEHEGTSSLAAHLWLKPVRGYPGHYRKVRQRLAGAGYAVTVVQDGLFCAAEAYGQQPGSYSSKIDVELQPDMRSDLATKAVLNFLLGVMRRNEPGVRDDIDTEFLHDYRVAVRRTRSALGQVKNVFPPEMTERFKRDFATIGDFTNELRDLDVYLLNEAHYLELLPETVRGDIGPLFSHLRTKRSQALQNVLMNLDSEAYSRNLAAWEAFLSESPAEASLPENAERPIIELASRRIYKRYRQIVKTGNSILENTEDSMLHRLRIDCKKLRYLLEFFSSLYPRKDIATLVDQLKQLQDNLGDFNDMCVQQEYLLNIVEELPLSAPKTPNTLVAVGTLVGTLDQKKKQVKDEFADTFASFSSGESRELYRELFAKPERKTSR